MNFAGFIVAGTLAASFSVLLLFQKTLYSAALCLLGVLLQIATLYFLLGAQILALIQVLVYAGAVMVLIVLAVMTAAPRARRLWAGSTIPPWLAAAALLAPAFEAGMFCVRSAPAAAAAWARPVSPSLERSMAEILFGPYALMTETAGMIILLSALALALAEG